MTHPFLEIQNFNTADDFFGWLDASPHFRLHNGHFAGRGSHGGWIFRGQSNAAWTLLPSAFRSGAMRRHNPLSHDFQSGCKVMKVHEALAQLIRDEFHEAYTFVRDADSLGLTAPLDMGVFNVHEDYVRQLWGYEDFLLRREGTIDRSGFPEYGVAEALALAQHHGVPTRLLDWSESPMVAAYFAAQPHSRVAGSATSAGCERMAIFALKTGHLLRSVDYDRPHFEVIQVPRHRNAYLHAQRGVFTLTPNANQYALKTGRLPSLEDILEQWPNPAEILKVTLPVDQADSVLRRLYRHDITTASLMPSMDNVSTLPAYRHRLFPQERGLAPPGVAPHGAVPRASDATQRS